MIELSAFIRAKNSEKNANLKLLPIFFKISPKELSAIREDSQWKRFAESKDRTGNWDAAIKEIRSIKGEVLDENGNEVDCRAKVVKAICRLLEQINPEPPLRLLDFEPVGIEDQVMEVKALLGMEGPQSALAVLVCGFGGVGKSTIAASVVQSMDLSSMNFKFCRVAVNENSPDKTSHIIQLQKDIIYKLRGVNPDLRNPDEGRIQIINFLKNKCSLIFIDNVVDKDYIQDLLPKDLSFREQKPESDAEMKKPESDVEIQKTKLRILITARQEDVKAKLNINCEVHTVRTLSELVSQRLLSETIVQDKVVEDKDFDEKTMINQVAKACSGVPLLLSVFGQHLRMERDKNNYQEALDVLREGNLEFYRDEDLGRIIMHVYHKIKDEEVREAFLDICMYFHGSKWDLVGDIVDFSKLEDLRRRMLVSKSGSGEVIVHDILRLMGIKDAKLTRFLNYKELSDAYKLNGFDVKGISLLNEKSLITLESKKLEAMHQSVRILMLGDWVTLDGTPLDKAFTNLRYLRVGDIAAFPFKDPSKLDKLRVFMNGSKPGMNLPNLPPNLRRISYQVPPDVKCDKFAKLPFQNLRSLKSLIVGVRKSKSVELPEALHLPASLEHLNLNRCKNLPKDISHLTALESLILDGSDLECLPQGFGNLNKLKLLSMDCCSKLALLSEDIGMLSSLETLSMKECRNLRALPESFGELLIQSLHLHSLANLHGLPDSFGSMPLLKDLSLISCDSLASLPNSFVQLKMLETLEISDCTKLSLLPEDFGRLRCLKNMSVIKCHLLKELPHGFGALLALKTLTLRGCNSFVNLSRDFGELTCLEELRLKELPLVSRMPDGFGKLKKLKTLHIEFCSQLQTLSDDFENLATLERLSITSCPELDGAMMEKILKLENCYKAEIFDSNQLEEKWRHMKAETEHPIIINMGYNEKKESAMGAALLHGKCMEVKDGSDQLIERSSLLEGLEEGISATVALFMLPIDFQSHQRQTLQQFVQTASKKAESNGSGRLQIVCARKERPTRTEEEERAEEEGIRQMLLSLPKGSCVIPSSESKRIKVLTYWFQYDKLSFCMANVGVDRGRKRLQNLFLQEVEISGNAVMESYPSKMESSPSEMESSPSPSEMESEKENEHLRSIQNFIESICAWNSSLRGADWAGEFRQALKDSGIDHLLIHGNTTESKVMVDDLHGKTIGFIVCHFEFLECIKLQHIYKDIQQKDLNFIAIWIPIGWPKDYGHGSYTRLIQCMPWATLPHPGVVQIHIKFPRFVVLDKDGQMANRDALRLLLAWGAEWYPFAWDTIPESLLSLMESESCLEFLLHGMNIVGREPMGRKITFLYAEKPRGGLEMKSVIEELTQIHGNFEVLYVGIDIYHFYNVGKMKEDYEEATQNMSWPSLSFSDMVRFWYRRRCLAWSREPKIMRNAVHGLAENLYDYRLVVVDKNGVVTGVGYDVVQMICGSWGEMSEGERMVKEEVMRSLSRGECTPLVKTFFKDEIDNHPLHPQHTLRSNRYNYVRGSGDDVRGCDDCDWRVKSNDNTNKYFHSLFKRVLL